jgi:hypothetical protein
MMRWKIESYVSRFGVWRKWFAWYPVAIDRQMVWLETVERKVECYGGVGGLFCSSEYRLPKPPDVK